MVQIDTRPPALSIPENVRSWGHIGPLLTIYLAEAAGRMIAMLVGWRDSSRVRLDGMATANPADVRRCVQALDWIAITATIEGDGAGESDVQLGGYIFSRSVRDGRYVYEANPGLDPWGVETLTDERLPSEWARDLTGINPLAAPEPVSSWLVLPDGGEVELVASNDSF